MVLAQQIAALVFAIVLATGAGILTGEEWSIGSLDATTWLTAATSGILYYGLAFCLFISALRHVPATFAGALIPLTPVVGIAAGYLAGERLNSLQWTGAALVICATATVAIQQLVKEDRTAN